ncbi:uncharacterized protein (DUF1684 family) [Kitasatospora sp. MAP12-15]|uniref:DUF1684 domain-containing protein n=1 Tax=unclassified Kitasatospora TaxID=2633591 RepID=UPI002474AB33|nr:DUF1684 domain-containing protein [Kitasatospora sp. MAP12-44]MDH6113562.1 uncharacterized protein (DUF1684 family) [Kitasatospora sp. MAP12-44]
MSAADEWKAWSEARAEAVSTPHGVLALVGTYWLDASDTEIPGVPGRWSRSGDSVRVTAAAADGLAVAERPVDGELLLHPDTHPEAAVAGYGEVRLIPIEREGELALRVFDPASEARARFAGISAYPYQPQWSLPAVFTPFDSGDRTLTVPNADGRERGLDVAGLLSFELAGEARTLTVSRSGERLSGVISDAGSGRETYRFRFVTLPAPDAQGRTVLDLNRAHLPPCAFADHFVCPFPPPGNRLPVEVRAGEKAVLQR